MNWDQVVELFSPHPGIGGATVPLPEAVRLVALELDGRTLPLGYAVEKIKEACPEGTVKINAPHPEGHPNGVIKPDYGMICLGIGNIHIRENFDLPEHNWRVIKFKEVK